MNIVISKFISKIDNSTTTAKHQNKPVVLKIKGPHIGLYVKTNNKYIWVCWVNKSKQRLLSEMGVKTPRKQRYKLN